jgi:hypothetical protein
MLTTLLILLAICYARFIYVLCRCMGINSGDDHAPHD